MGVSCKLRGSRLAAPSASVSSRPARFASLSSASRPSPAVLAHKATSPVSFRMDRTSRLHLPAPLRSPGITRLHRYYGCSDSCAEARRRGPFCSSRRAVPWNPFSSCAAQVSSLHVFHSLQSLPSPTTQLPPMIALSPTSSASWASCSRRSGLRLSLAGSPVSMAESSLLSLRTTPFAFHCSPPVSRRRSYGRLQADVG
jgi:hypothetical protein